MHAKADGGRRNAAPPPAACCSGAGERWDEGKSGWRGVGGRRRRVARARSIEGRTSRRSSGDTSGPAQSQVPMFGGGGSSVRAPASPTLAISRAPGFSNARCRLSPVPAARRSRRPSSLRSPRSPSAARRPPHPRSARHPALDPRCARARATTPRARSRPTRRPRLARRASSSTAMHASWSTAPSGLNG